MSARATATETEMPAANDACFNERKTPGKTAPSAPPGPRFADPAAQAMDPLPSSQISPYVAKTLDRLFNSQMAHVTGGIDPRVVPLSFLDWWVKLCWSPGTHLRLSEKAWRKALDRPGIRAYEGRDA